MKTVFSLYLLALITLIGCGSSSSSNDAPTTTPEDSGQPIEESNPEPSPEEKRATEQQAANKLTITKESELRDIGFYYTETYDVRRSARVITLGGDANAMGKAFSENALITNKDSKKRFESLIASIDAYKAFEPNLSSESEETLNLKVDLAKRMIKSIDTKLEDFDDETSAKVEDLMAQFVAKEDELKNQGLTIGVRFNKKVAPIDIGTGRSTIEVKAELVNLPSAEDLTNNAAFKTSLEEMDAIVEQLDDLQFENYYRFGVGLEIKGDAFQSVLETLNKQVLP